MTSKNSFFKLIRQDLTRRLWAVTLALLGALCGLTLPVVICIRSYYQEVEALTDALAHGLTGVSPETLLDKTSENIYSILTPGNPLIKLVLIVLAILCGVAMFRYLHDRRQVDFYHSLPISRGRLFWVRYVTGAAAVLPVYLLVLLLTLAAAWGMGFGSALSAAAVAHGILCNVTFFLLNYTVAVLCTVLTGNTIITVLLGCWAEFGLPVAALLCQGLMGMAFETYVTSPAWMHFTMRHGSPIVLSLLAGVNDTALPLIGMISGMPGLGAVLGALAATAVLSALAYVLFVRRRSERAGTAIAFRPMQEPLKWFMCVVVGLLFGFFFEMLVEWFWFGMIAGLVLCHMLVEIIYEFDFKAILHHWKRMIALLVVAVGGTAVFLMDPLGYDTYLPARDEIVSAGLDPSGNWDTYPSFDSSQATQLTESSNIDAIYALAQLGVNGLDTPSEDSRQSTVRFTLQNGRTIDRRYNNIDYAAGKTHIRALLTNEEYVRKCTSLQAAVIPETDAQGWANLQLRTNATVYGGDADATLHSLDDVRAVVEALQQAQIDNREAHLTEFPVLRMDLETQWDETYLLQEGSTSRTWTYLHDIPVYPSDTAALALIEQLTGVTPHDLTAADVRALDVFVATQADYDAAYDTVSTDSFDVVNESGQDAFRAAHTTHVTDPAAISALLAHAIPDVSAGLGGMDAAFEEVFDGLYVEVCAEMNANGEEISLHYPAGQAPMDALRTYLK